MSFSTTTTLSPRCTLLDPRGRDGTAAAHSEPPIHMHTSSPTLDLAFNSRRRAKGSAPAPYNKSGNLDQKIFHGSLSSVG
jgi:hypothetical protein